MVPVWKNRVFCIHFSYGYVVKCMFFDRLLLYIKHFQLQYRFFVLFLYNILSRINYFTYWNLTEKPYFCDLILFHKMKSQLQLFLMDTRVKIIQKHIHMLIIKIQLILSAILRFIKNSNVVNRFFYTNPFFFLKRIQLQIYLNFRLIKRKIYFI